MFTSLEKFGLVCISIVGFQISRFLFRVIYNNFLAPTLGLNRVNLKEMGKWAGKKLDFVVSAFFFCCRQ